MKVITFASAKGGVGKSTATILISNCFAARGYKVLVVDLDTNNSTSLYYTRGIPGIEKEISLKNSKEALSHREKGLDEFIIHSRLENVDVIASTVYLNDIVGITDNALSVAIKNTPALNYDFLVIDTPPVYSGLTRNGIKSADFIFTPLEFDTFNLTTSQYLDYKMHEDFEDKLDSWYQIYFHYQESMAEFNTSAQSQFAKIFEETFSNILADVHVPDTKIAKNYIDFDEKVSVNSKTVGSQRIATEINKICSLITQDDKIAEVF